MSAIYKKELHSLYNSVIGWLFAATILLMTGLFFTAANLFGGSPYISYSLNGVIVVFFISIPILTMKTLAEERRNKTDQLLLTSPLSVGKIVTGKFLALCTVFLAAILVVCLYPLVLGMFGEVPKAENYLGIFGFFLTGVLCISVGMFFSSLTENQIIAAVTSFGALILGYFMTGIREMISSTGNIITDFLGIFDYPEKMSPFLNGIFDVKAFVYFVSVTALLLFLTCQSIERRRWTVSAKNMKLGAYSLGLAVISVAVAVVLNMAAAKLPSKYTELDATTQKLYTLSEESIELAKKVDKPIVINIIAPENSQDKTLRKTIETYAEYSKNITVKSVDPNVNPNFHKKYADRVSVNSLIIESGDKFRVVDYSEIYAYDVDYSTMENKITGYDGEGKITSAISYLTGGVFPKIYAVQGHGEMALGANYEDALKKANMELSKVSLLQLESIPQDVECVIVNAPQTDFSSDDADKLIEYIKGGGKTMLTVGLTEGELPNYDRVLAHYGITNTYRMIFEGDGQYFYQSPLYLIPNVLSTVYTDDLIRKNMRAFAPLSMALQFDAEAGGYGAFAPLLVTEDGYAKANPQTVEDAAKADGDLVDTFYIGAVLKGETGTEAEDGAKSEDPIAAFFATGEILSNASDGMVSGANSTLFSNIMSQMLSSGTVATVPIKSFDVSPVLVDESSAIMIAALLTVILPIMLLAAGIVIWAKRRRV